VAREEILAKLRERIVAYAASRLGRDTAEDIAQEVMILLETKYGAVEALDELVPLSLEITRRKLVAHWRKQQRRGEDRSVSAASLPLADPRPHPDEELERRERLERLAAAVSRLPPRCRELLRLKLEGKRFAEIQQVLGVRSVNTLYVWDLRCRRKLMKLLGDWV
jgi:RNA polymerase sigma-70 factor (ECF subfamily)